MMTIAVPMFLIWTVIIFMLGMWAIAPLYRGRLWWVIERERELGKREKHCAEREIAVQKARDEIRGSRDRVLGLIDNFRAKHGRAGL